MISDDDIQKIIWIAFMPFFLPIIAIGIAPFRFFLSLSYSCIFMEK